MFVVDFVLITTFMRLRNHLFARLTVRCPVTNCLSSFIDLNRSLLHMHVLNLTVVTDVGSSPAMATCETSQVLLAGVGG